MFRLDVGNAGVQRIEPKERPAEIEAAKAGAIQRVVQACKRLGAFFRSGVSRLSVWSKYRKRSLD